MGLTSRHGKGSTKENRREKGPCEEARREEDDSQEGPRQEEGRPQEEDGCQEEERPQEEDRQEVSADRLREEIESVTNDVQVQEDAFWPLQICALRRCAQ